MVSINRKTIIPHIMAAAHEASKSPMRFKHGAVIIKNGKLISSGYNNRISRPFVCNGADEWSIHAEIAVINNVQNFKLLENAELFVVRVLLNDNSEIMKINSSKPCAACRVKLIKIMKKYKMKCVYYTSENLCL